MTSINSSFGQDFWNMTTNPTIDEPFNEKNKTFIKKNKASRRDHWISMIEPYYYSTLREREAGQRNNSKKKNILQTLFDRK